MQKCATPTTAVSQLSHSRPSPPTRTRRAANTSRRPNGIVAWSSASLPSLAGNAHEKGAHVQIEGELRSREIATKNSDFKRRIWEIRVDSILKLDRAEKAGPEDQDTGEEPAA